MKNTNISGTYFLLLKVLQYHHTAAYECINNLVLISDKLKSFEDKSYSTAHFNSLVCHLNDVQVFWMLLQWESCWSAWMHHHNHRGRRHRTDDSDRNVRTPCLPGSLILNDGGNNIRYHRKVSVSEGHTCTMSPQGWGGSQTIVQSGSFA